MKLRPGFLKCDRCRATVHKSGGSPGPVGEHIRRRWFCIACHDKRSRIEVARESLREALQGQHDADAEETAAAEGEA